MRGWSKVLVLCFCFNTPKRPGEEKGVGTLWIYFDTCSKLVSLRDFFLFGSSILGQDPELQLAPYQAS